MGFVIYSTEKSPPSSFSLSIRMIISFSIKFSKVGSGEKNNISPGIKMVARTHPHHSRTITQRRAHKVTENQPREKHVRIFFGNIEGRIEKNIFPVSNKWRKKTSRKKRREKQESKRGLMTALPSFLYFLGVAFWIRARIFCVTESTKSKGKIGAERRQETQSRRARREIDDTSTDTNTQRVTHTHTTHLMSPLDITREAIGKYIKISR